MDGDFVECGTNKDMLTRAIVHYTNCKFVNKTFSLIDTSSGIVVESEPGSERQRKNSSLIYTVCFEEVKNTFSEFRNVVICRGVIPDFAICFRY